MPSGRFCGITISPKSGELCMVWQAGSSWSSSRNFAIANAVGDWLGGGWFDPGDDEDYYSSEDATGFPRVHTSEGVETREAGYGTALYTGLCLAAKLQHDDKIRISLRTEGPGISSNQSRSGSAQKWWNRAREKFDLVDHIETDVEREESDTFSDRGRGDPGWFNESYLEGEEVSSISIRSYEVEIEYDKTISTFVSADAYPYRNAEGKRLIVADIVRGDPLRLERPEGGHNDFASSIAAFDVDEWIQAIGEVDPEVLARANYGIFANYGDEGHAAFQHIMRLAKHLGLSRQDMERMQLRYLLGVDVEFDYREQAAAEARMAQMGVPTGARGYERMVEAARMAEEATPNRRRARHNGLRVKLYGRKGQMRQNPEDPRIAPEAMRLADERRELGWDVFADDDS